MIRFFQIPALGFQHSRYSIALLLVGILLSSTAWTKVEYDSTSLLIKNSDQVGELIKKKIKKSQELQSKQPESEDSEIPVDPNAVELLKDAMRIVLARPDQDGARANLYSRVRSELTDLNSLEQVLTELTEESLAELRQQDGPRRTATYVVILENLMSEVRPEAKEVPAYRKILERVRDAKITIEDKAKIKNLLRSMSIPVSPSVTAQKFLEKDFPEVKNPKAKK